MSSISINKIGGGYQLPVLFCLDVSGSMFAPRGPTRVRSIDLLKKSVEAFLSQMGAQIATKSAIEVAFVTFGGAVEETTEFQRLSNVQQPSYREAQIVGTRMASAVRHSLEKIENHLNELSTVGQHYYSPFLVIVTDGRSIDPEAETCDVLAQLKKHCVRHRDEQNTLIIPFVVGVGDEVDRDALTDYSAGFTKGFFPIPDQSEQSMYSAFQTVFDTIRASVRTSVNLNRPDEAIKRIQEQMQKAQERMARSGNSSISRASLPPPLPGTANRQIMTQRLQSKLGGK